MSEETFDQVAGSTIKNAKAIGRLNAFGDVMVECFKEDRLCGNCKVYIIRMLQELINKKK